MEISQTFVAFSEYMNFKALFICLSIIQLINQFLIFSGLDAVTMWILALRFHELLWTLATAERAEKILEKPNP